MESFEGKFMGYDPVRHRDAAIENRLSETKNKLMYSAERKLQAFLNSKKIVGARVLSTRVDKLDITEDVETGSPVFTGKIIAEVSFLDKQQEKTAMVPVVIVDGTPEVVASEVEKALETATVAEVAASELTSTKVTASLNEFKLVDDGTKYLKVYHTAAYGDLEPIGAVSKEEYDGCGDKTSLLTEMFKDEAVSWPAAVEFTGEFKEPAIEKAAHSEEKPYYVVKAWETPTDVVENTNTDYKFKSFDNIRFAMEQEELKYNDLKKRIGQRASVVLADAFRSRKLGNVKITNIATEYDNDSQSGKVIIETELLDGKDAKVVPFEIKVSGLSMELPDLGQIASLLKKAETVEARNEKLEKEKKAAAEAEKKVKGVKKQATPMAPPNIGYQEVLRLPKDFLPASLKEGDIIEVDGLYWKLSSKSEGQLSNQRDTASHWTFVRVPNERNPVYKQQSY